MNFDKLPNSAQSAIIATAIIAGVVIALFIFKIGYILFAWMFSISPNITIIISCWLFIYALFYVEGLNKK